VTNFWLAGFGVLQLLCEGKRATCWRRKWGKGKGERGEESKANSDTEGLLEELLWGAVFARKRGELRSTTNHAPPVIFSPGF